MMVICGIWFLLRCCQELFSAEDALSDAMLKAKTISFHIEGMLEDDEKVPTS